MFVLMSSISHSVSFHICGGEIENVAIFGKAQSCEDHGNACDHGGSTNHTSINQKGCCEDATVLIDSDKYASKKTETITVESLYVFLPVAQLVQGFSSLKGLTFNHFLHYRPPLIERDIIILVQTFLI